MRFARPDCQIRAPYLPRHRYSNVMSLVLLHHRRHTYSCLVVSSSMPCETFAGQEDHKRHDIAITEKTASTKPPYPLNHP